MKLRTDPKHLADAVAWTAKALPSRPSVPVLAGLLLRAADGVLHVSGFDYETSSSAAVDTHPGGEDGTVLVSGRLLAEIAKALPNKPVDLAAVGAHLQIVCGSARFTLPTMPVEDYPALPGLPEPVGSVDAATFAAAVAQVAVAATTDATLPMMTGVRVEFAGSTLALLATDRYRLAVREIEWRPVDPGIDAAALVPAQTLAGAAKTLGADGGDITIGLAGDEFHGGGVVGFATARREATSRLLDGDNYPPVRTLFPDPQAITSTARVPVAALAEVARRVSLVAERSTPVLLTFTADGLTVEAGGAEEARASEAMGAVFDGPQSLTVGFNPQFLLDGLAQLGAPTVVFEFVDSFKPAVLLPAVGEDADPDRSYRYLLMPIRVTR